MIENPIKVEPQENNRLWFWGEIEELGGRMLRVITLEDKITIHNVFPGGSSGTQAVELNFGTSIARGFAPLDETTQWFSVMVKPLKKFERDGKMW